MSENSKRNEDIREETADTAQEPIIGEEQAEEFTEAEKLAKALEEKTNSYLYLYAEFDNYKKRNRNIAQEKFEDGRNSVICDMLSVLDNIDRAIASIKDDSQREGVEMIKKQMSDTFKRYGVEEIDAIGQPFDPKYHNAIMNCEDAENSGKVVQQAQKGYKIGDKILRYAQVVVAK